MALQLHGLAAMGMTDWNSISSMLPAHADKLPTPPTVSAARALYAGVLLGGGAPFASFTVEAHAGTTTLTNSRTRVNLDHVACSASFDEAALVAGPSHLCSAAESSGCADCICRGRQADSAVCLASTHFSPSIQLVSKIGSSGWAPQSAFPSYIQLTFPAVPSGSSSITLRFTMDQRYRPQLYGGNPCPAASPSYNCSLCVAGPWDYSMAAGIHVLWSAAGRSDYVFGEPLTGLQASWDKGEHEQILQSPPELALAPGDFPVVTFFVFNQYLGSAEVVRDHEGKCRPDMSTPEPYPLANRNTAFFLESATLLYRQQLVLPLQPPLARPRLHGSDSECKRLVRSPREAHSPLSRTPTPSCVSPVLSCAALPVVHTGIALRVQPFLNLPCEPNAQQNLGYFGKAGVWDAKGYWEKAALDYMTCAGQAPTPHDDIAQNSAAARYLDTEDAHSPPRFLDGRRCLYLLRRLWHCADQNSGSYASCEHSEAETARLARAVVDSDLHSFHHAPSTYKVSGASPVSFQCGANPTNGGVCKFDLNVQEQVAYFALWYDVLSSRPGLVSPANLSAVADGMLSRIELFRSHFDTGDWRLWNGNNWTPRLSIGALNWVIAFWHEQPIIARDVLGMINDLLWLHYPVFYLADGTPVEGISYSYMSIEDAVELSEMQRAAFGEAPRAIRASITLMEGAIPFHLASLSGDGRMIDFGDSHAIAGYTPRTLELAAARRIMLNNHSGPLKLEPCQARELCAGTRHDDDHHHHYHLLHSLSLSLAPSLSLFPLSPHNSHRGRYCAHTACACLCDTR